MKNTIEIIELFLDEMNPFSGVDAYSFVNSPAIESDFVHFHKEFYTNFSTIDEEKRLVVGPALIPNKMILRENKGEYFYVYFSEDTIRKTSQKFLMNGNQKNATVEHQLRLENISVVESWMIEDTKNDKSNMYGFDLPVGTWMLTSRVDDDSTWERIKSGELKGYSIEGIYTDQILANSITKEVEEFKAEMELYGTEEEKVLYKKILNLIENITEE